jgi:cyclophilin family peptidyl-prolyl cis-trans isomerase/predicted small lipoprotein YifL
MNMKKIISAVMALSMIFALSGCGDDGTATTTAGEKDSGKKTTAENKTTADNTTENNTTENTAAENNTTAPSAGGEYMSLDKNISQSFLNFETPEQGEEIIVMTIKDYGTVKIQLFPEVVPVAVENFVTHAKDGYYDGLTFHRIISEFMIQGGDPLGTGTGGESIWGSKFESGMTAKLHHFTGALAYANSGATSTSGSQFYICVNKTLTDADMQMYYDGGYRFDEETMKKYIEVGGQPYLDAGIFGGSGYTVFGQVFEGQDVVEAVSKVQTASDRPIQPVIIETVKVEQYQG